MTMKKKLKTPLGSGVPLSLTKGLIPAETVVTKKTNGNSEKTNGNGKPKQSQKNVDEYDILNERELLKVLSEVKNGNFKVRMPIDKMGVTGKIYDTLNEIITINELLVDQLTLARNTIGKQGQLNHRVELPKYARGSWSTG